MKKHRYQLVLQFAIDSATEGDLDRLFELQEKLTQRQDGFFVDGNDIGSGEMNIFLLTDDPRSVFRNIQDLLPRNTVWKAAYRSSEDDTFEVLHPVGSGTFRVK